LRQSHSGKTAAHNHNPFGKVWRAGFSFLHVQVTVASPTTRHFEKFIFWTQTNEWGEHPTVDFGGTCREANEELDWHGLTFSKRH
jgi:hypothetical protein